MNKENKSLVVSNNSLPVEMKEAYYVPTGDHVEIGLIWRILRRRWLLMLVSLLVVLGIGVIYQLTKRPVYEATTLLMVANPQSVAANSNDVGLMSDLLATTKNRSVESQILLLTTPEIMNEAVRALGPDKIHDGFNADELPSWAVDVEPMTTKAKKDTDVISVSARAYDRNIAALLANQICVEYINRDLSSSNAATKQAGDYVSSELKSVETKLADARKKLADFKRATKLVAADEQIRGMAVNELSLEMERDKANVELASAGNQANTLNTKLKEQGTEIQASSTFQMSPQYQDSMVAVSKLYAQRASLIQEYKPDSKEVKQIDAQIAETERQMKKFGDSIVAAKVRARNPILDTFVNAVVNKSAATAKVGALNKAIVERNKELAKLPEEERNAIHLTQEVTTLERTYYTLSDSYYHLKINEKSQISNARVVSSALPPPRPVEPNPIKNGVIFLLLGLMASTGAALLAERLDRKVRDDVLVAEITGEPPLAIVPERKALKSKTPKAIVVAQKNAFAEAFKMLRNAIAFNALDRPMKLLAVTSPGRGEGKSTISMNLATAMATAGKRVLIVDCDFRRPSMHKYLGLDNEPGLSKLLKGLTTLDKVVVSTKTENVYCIPAGEYIPNASEVLQTELIHQLFIELSEQYDFVILDCPPCQGLSDMQIISHIVDGVLLVVSINQSIRRSLYDTLFSLKQVGAPVIGYVVNRLELKRTSYWSYGYGDEVDYDPGSENSQAALPAGRVKSKTNKKK